MFKSTNWICYYCLGSALPFNHYVDDDEFTHEINQLFQDQTVSFTKLQSLHINPFNINNLDKDNDHNMNDYPDNGNIDSCNYLLSDDFNDKFTNINSNFSLIHFNARSLKKNFDSITDYLLTLNHNFSVIGTILLTA